GQARPVRLGQGDGMEVRLVGIGRKVRGIEDLPNVDHEWTSWHHVFGAASRAAVMVSRRWPCAKCLPGQKAPCYRSARTGGRTCDFRGPAPSWIGPLLRLLLAGAQQALHEKRQGSADQQADQADKSNPSDEV